jgi:phage-related protein
MYKIIFYEDTEGYSSLKDYLKELRNKSNDGNKDARINFFKIVAYIDTLEKEGTRVGVPVVKHLDGDIWELRPLSNRILFAFYKDNTFILLHYFQKKTQKTPRREILKAIRELEDYKRRFPV